MSSKTFIVFTVLFLLPIAVSAGIRQKVINEFVSVHNAVRHFVGEPPLTWNYKVAYYAKQWARKRANDCKLIHSNGPYGENLYWFSGAANLRPAAVVDSWASEKVFYNPKLNSCAEDQKCGHYTQIVWKDTCSFGCAIVRCRNSKGSFVICNYDPPGNYVNEHPFGTLRV